MKLFITSDIKRSREGYTAVRCFKEFEAILSTNEPIEEIYIVSYLLGLVCLYWCIDHFREKMKMISYTINLDDRSQSECLKQMVKRYAKEDKNGRQI